MRFAALALSLLLSACGATAIRTHAVAANATGVILEDACTQVRTLRFEAMREAVNASEFQEEARARVDQVRLRYQPAVDSCNAASDVQGQWVDSIALAASGADFDIPHAIDLGRSVLRLWADLSSALTGIGIDVPAPPVFLSALAAEVPR